jgi:hypothetical protein
MSSGIRLGEAALVEQGSNREGWWNLEKLLR